MSIEKKFAKIYLENPFCIAGLYVNCTMIEGMRAKKKFEVNFQAGNWKNIITDNPNLCGWLKDIFKSSLEESNANESSSLEESNINLSLKFNDFFSLDKRNEGKNQIDVQTWFINDALGSFDFILMSGWDLDKVEKELRKSVYSNLPEGLHNRIVVGLMRLGLSHFSKLLNNNDLIFNISSSLILQEIYEAADKLYSNNEWCSLLYSRYCGSIFINKGQLIFGLLEVMQKLTALQYDDFIYNDIISFKKWYEEIQFFKVILDIKNSQLDSIPKVLQKLSPFCVKKSSVYELKFTVYPTFRLNFWNDIANEVYKYSESLCKGSPVSNFSQEQCKNVIEVAEALAQLELEGSLCSDLKKILEELKKIEVNQPKVEDNNEAIKETKSRKKTSRIIISFLIIIALIIAFFYIKNSGSESMKKLNNCQLSGIASKNYLYDGNLNSWLSEVGIDDRNCLIDQADFDQIVEVEPVIGTVSDETKAARYYLSAVVLRYKNQYPEVSGKFEQQTKDTMWYIKKSLEKDYASPAVYLLADMLSTSKDREYFKRKLFCDINKKKVANKDYELLRQKKLISEETFKFIRDAQGGCDK